MMIKRKDSFNQFAFISSALIAAAVFLGCHPHHNDVAQTAAQPAESKTAAKKQSPRQAYIPPVYDPNLAYIDPMTIKPVDEEPLVIAPTDEENQAFRARAAERQAEREAAEVETFGRVLTDLERREVREFGRPLSPEERLENERLAAARQTDKEALRLKERELELEENRLAQEAALETERLKLEEEKLELERDRALYPAGYYGTYHGGTGGYYGHRRVERGTVIKNTGKYPGGSHGGVHRPTHSAPAPEATPATKKPAATRRGSLKAD